MLVLVSWFCCNKLSQIYWYETTHLHYLTVLQVQILISDTPDKSQISCFLLEASKGKFITSPLLVLLLHIQNTSLISASIIKSPFPLLQSNISPPSCHQDTHGHSWSHLGLPGKSRVISSILKSLARSHLQSPCCWVRCHS